MRTGHVSGLKHRFGEAREHSSRRRILVKRAFEPTHRKPRLPDLDRKVRNAERD